MHLLFKNKKPPFVRGLIVTPGFGFGECMGVGPYRSQVHRDLLSSVVAWGVCGMSQVPVGVNRIQPKVAGPAGAGNGPGHGVLPPGLES